MLLDIGVGILISILASSLFHVPLTAWFVTFGIISALAPDLDYLAHLARGGTSHNAHRHRELLHYPLLLVPIGFFIMLPFGLPYASIFATGALLHLIHDSIGLGWGVPWLYPFRKDHYTFFYRYHAPGKPAPLRQWLYLWKYEELDALNQEHGDPDWIKNVYLAWHPYAIVEFLVFVIAIVTLYRSL